MLYAAVYNHAIAIEILTENNIFISDITEIELLGYHKLTNAENDVLCEVIANLNVVPISGKIKQKAIALRRKNTLKTPDPIIVATAMELDYFLVTADKKLQKIENVEVIEFEVPE